MGLRETIYAVECALITKNACEIVEKLLFSGHVAMLKKNQHTVDLRANLIQMTRKSTFAVEGTLLKTATKDRVAAILSNVLSMTGSDRESIECQTAGCIENVGGAVTAANQTEYVEKPSVLTHLLADAAKSLTDLSTAVVVVSDVVANSDSVSKSIVVSSPHPFTDPHECHGKISIPKNWKGSSIVFNPKV